MKFQLIEELQKPLSESLHSLDNGMYITDSAYTIRDLLLNKPKAYRLLFDANIDSYMICDANDYIHDDMLEKAIRQKYYVGAKNDDSLVQLYIDNMNKYPGERCNYVDLGTAGYYEDDDGNMVEFPCYFLYMIYVPKDVDEDSISNSPSSDGYDDEIECEHGTLYFRDAYLDDFRKSCDLLKILK